MSEDRRNTPRNPAAKFANERKEMQQQKVQLKQPKEE
jgi:hypothetical protein